MSWIQAMCRELPRQKAPRLGPSTSLGAGS